MKKKELTLKQKKAIKLLVENLGMPIGEAMRQAGYSDNSADNPKNLTDSDGFKAILEEAGVTDKAIAKVIHGSFTAKKVIGYLHNYKKTADGKIEKAGADESVSNEFLEVEDIPTQLKGAELACKVKGHMKEKVEHSGDIIIDFKGGDKLRSEAEAAGVSSAPGKA